jgi:hypothetical protein
VEEIFHKSNHYVYDQLPVWSSGQEFMAADTEVPVSIPGATRFYEKQWVWNWVHSVS